MIFICFSSSSKILTHQMSSGALTAALGRSNRDRDITDLVPSAPECSYAACFCEVIKLANTFHTISYNVQLWTIKSTLMKHLNTHNYLGKCLEASWSCSAVSTCRIVQNICGVCVQSKTGCTFVETKGWPRWRKGNKKYWVFGSHWENQISLYGDLYF